MLSHLAKLAARSAQLREASTKEAGLVGAVASAAKGLGSWAVNSPGKALLGGLGAMSAVSGVGQAKGKYKQFKAGFDPAVQQAMLGAPPTGT